MKKYEELENLVLIKDKLIYPSTEKHKDLAVLLNTNRVEETIDIINNTQLKNYRAITRYYIPRKYKYKVLNKTIKSTIKTRDICDEVSKNVTGTLNDYLNIAQYKNVNVFIDLFKLNELYSSCINTNTEATKKIDAYIKLIKEFSTSIPGYNKRIMIFDLNNVEINVQKMFSYMKANSPLTYILTSMIRNPKEFKSLNFDILLIKGNYKFKIIPSQFVKDHINKIKKNLSLMRNVKIEQSVASNIDTKVTVEDKDDKDISINIKVSKRVKHNFTGEIVEEDDKVERLIDDNIDEKVKEVVEEMELSGEDVDEEEIAKQVEEKMNSDEELLTNLQINANDSFTNNSAINIKRNKLLEEKQAKLKVNKSGKTIEEILKESDTKKIEKVKVKSRAVNTDMEELTFPAFCKSYNSELMEKDTIAIINFFKDKRIPVYILDIQKEDTSDNFNRKWTYTVKMESADRERHTLKFDFPKPVDEQYFIIGGNKKNMLTQMFLKPVSKTGPNTVQLCSNYNKIFINRTGTRLSPKIERLKKAMSIHKGVNIRSNVFYKLGDNSLANTAYLSNIEYDDFASMYHDIYTASGKYHFYFNQDDIREAISELKLKFEKSDRYLPVCILDKKTVIYLDVENDVIKGTDKQLSDYIIDSIPIKGFKEELSNITTGKKFIYTEATIMKRHIPILLLTSYLEGITMVLKKAEIKHYFTDNRERLSVEDKNNKEVVRFADGYLVYDRYPIQNSLIMNAISLLPTKDMNYSDLDSKEIYLSIFDNLYGDKKILNAFENFYDLFLDPITLEVLSDLNLPTDFVSLLLYASNLLADNQYTSEINMSLYRLRNNEIINGMLYKELANAYSVYRSSAGNKHPIKMTIPQDAVMKDLVTSQIIEDYSEINPYTEAEKARAATFKGPSGLNVEQAYTIEKRSYDKSMKGILAMSTINSGSVGLVRQLAFDVNILSPRGYIKVADSEDELNSANMFSPAELMTPGTAQFDEPARLAMTFSQTKHTVPVNKYDERLITNGADEVLPKILSNSFAFKAKEDGEVVEIDEKSNIMVLKYKSGKYDFVDISDKVSKNGAGGFYIVNKLETDLKPKSKFKKGDIVANNNKFFNKHGSEATCKIGTLTKIAIMSGYFTYEDATLITEKMSRNMTTNIVMPKKVSLGKNSNVTYHVNIGDRVEVGDPLLVFDESYADDSINKLLANMSTDIKNQLNATSKVPVKSKYAGLIQDIKVYYTVDKSELSPSLAKMINDINRPIKAKEKTISKYTDINDTDILLPPTEKVDAVYGKVKGEDVGEGVLIEFYVNYEDKLGIGDKISNDTALKCTICEIVPEGKEAYSEYRPDEEVSTFITPISELGRMTKSIEPNMFGNKVLIELKRQISDIVLKNKK